MEIYLIRHTTPAIAKGICYGQSDIPVMDTYPEECERVRDSLPPTVEVIYTSTLSRCHILARDLAAPLAIPVIPDARLMELNFGVWELKNWDDIDPGILLPWMDNYEHQPCPGGESYGDLVARVEAFTTMLNENHHESVAVVTHAGVIRAFHVVACGKTLGESMEIPVIYGQIHRCDL